MKIESLEKSNRKDKKYVVLMSDGKSYHFGLKNAITYVEGATKQKRDAFLARHLNNPLEKNLIENLIPSPALFSVYLLWDTPSLDENIKKLNRLFSKI
jgi:hypothetical protein